MRYVFLCKKVSVSVLWENLSRVRHFAAWLGSKLTPMLLCGPLNVRGLPALALRKRLEFCVPDVMDVCTLASMLIYVTGDGVLHVPVRVCDWFSRDPAIVRRWFVAF